MITDLFNTLYLATSGSPILTIRLFSNVDGAGLPNDGHLDGTGVGETVLDLVLDLACQDWQLVIGDFFRGDDDAQFPTGLDGE